ncbi:amino acid ABC transporter permease [Kineosporia sp. J2-2]|uniref:Amino acid ABC transporter permease n=1 Tax=Kineosporia corallincola TaxID=2835133 RepID=A0ABS5TF55_9ACTN|nr:amino acid ABC transporter permease [Kineosporia corallincola]MBT0769711.1 amino acid ABC transporter permease [Kineosporia corallincola]
MFPLSADSPAEQALGTRAGPVPDPQEHESPTVTTSSTADPLTGAPVVGLRHPWRLAASAVVLVIGAQIAHGLFSNPFYQWDRFRSYVFQPVVVDGLWITLQATAWSAVLGLLGGILLALMRLSGNPLLEAVSWTYIWLFRAVPLIVLLLFLFNFSALYPEIGIGIPFGPVFTAFDTTDLLGYMVIGVIGLSLNEAAYAAEVVRAGLHSVDQGQHEAADALGLSRARQFRRIVLPQALRSIVPAYVNQLVGLIKASSLLFYVSLLDLFGTVQMLASTHPGDIVPLLLVATVWYVFLTSVLSVVQFYVERHYARGALRTIPPTPLQKFRSTVRKRFA